MVTSIYETFLRLTGFREDEMARYLPEFRRTCDLFKISAEDVKHSVEVRIPMFYDVELEGVRKLLGCQVKELIDITHANEYKARGVKVVYGVLPAICIYYYALKFAAPDKLYVCFPDVFFSHVLNRLFHRKLIPILEEAEAHGMSYSCHHCALNKARYGARRLGIIPSADVSWIWGFVCDEGPKVDEFVNLMCASDWKTYLTRLPHDQPLFAQEDEDVERVTYLAAQMKDSFDLIQKDLGIKVTDADMKKVVDTYYQYNVKLRHIHELISTDPQPTLFTTGFLATAPIAAPYNTGLEGLSEGVDILIKELKDRVAKGRGILPKGAPRLYGKIPTGILEIQKLFVDNGIAIHAEIPPRKQAMPPSFSDPYMATAQQWLRIPGTTNLGLQVEQLMDCLETFKADALVLGFLDFDRWLGTPYKLMGRIIEERMKIPSFYIEGDNWEDRDTSGEALRTRIESIASIMKLRKGIYAESASR